ncbi:MAG TPA: type 4a pilus biogenesis protein PilO [Burkholderiales bacterium]|nr:type 4a pilus biogenesis protein PilO [Burkholderiales bacterium]
MAVGADFARMPTRQKVMVFVVIGALLGAVYYQFVYKGLEEDLASAQGENDAKKALNKQRDKEIPEFEKLKANMTTLTRIIEENQKALPTEAELPAFFETLNRKVLDSGVEVLRSKQGKEESIETFVKVPIDYEIQGSYTQIKKFFASLLPRRKKPGQVPDQQPGGEPAVEERERIVSIENLSLTAPVVKNREIKLTAKFTASTYRQEEKADATPPKAKPAASSGASPATPSPAAAGTPKGAKEQTEQAIDKGEKKDRNATGVEEAKTPSGADRMKEGK